MIRGDHKSQLAVLVFVVFAFASVTSLFAGKGDFEPNQDGYLLYTNPDGVMLDGHDAVAFFTENRPVAGSSRYQTTYQGGVYYFAGEESLRSFEADPERYAPLFGGFCALGVALGKLVPTDVSTFSIVDGRLVLQRNKRAKRTWSKDVAGNFARAEKHWPELLGDAEGPQK